MKIAELDRSFREIHRWHRKALETRLNRTGLFRAQHQILMYVAKHPQSSQKNIAEEFKISPNKAAAGQAGYYGSHPPRPVHGSQHGCPAFPDRPMG